MSDVLLASAARTATASSADQVNHGSTGVLFVVDATAASATPSVVPTVEVWDAGQGGWVTLASFTAITAISENLLVLKQGATAVGGVDEALSVDLPQGRWRLTMTHADADSITYSVSVATFE